MSRFLSAFALGLSVLSPCYGDTVHNVATALDYAGFDARGSRNPLSGGIDLLLNRQFNGNVFDFGATEVALAGPLSLQLSTGGRVVPGLEISLTTALNDRGQPVPLSYSYVSDIGPQSTSISGSTLVGASFSINALGFYDLTLTSSNRNTITREGVVADSTTRDADIGPINVSGNVFADALVVLTDPLFEQAGKENPFEVFSKQLISFLPQGPLSVVGAEGMDPLDVSQAIRTFDSPELPAFYGQGAVEHRVVPEPAALILMLLGASPVLLRSLRRS